MNYQTNNPVISVVVPCRNHAEELQRCLQGLTRQVVDHPYEIIVVDSANDPTVANVVAKFCGVRLVRSRAGLLAGGARNLGAEHATGRYLAFIDADCIPEPGWLAAAVSALDQGAQFIGGAILDAYPFHPIAVADNLLQFVDFHPNRPNGAASYFPGCNIALSQTNFQILGGFPIDVPTGQDVLFSSKAAQQWSNRICFVSEMRVRHSGRTYLREYWQHQEKFGYARGYLNIQLHPIYRRLGGLTILALPIAMKRLVYITLRTIQWNPLGLIKIIFLLPILLIGLFAWTKGFNDGCRAAPPVSPQFISTKI